MHLLQPECQENGRESARRMHRMAWSPARLLQHCISSTAKGEGCTLAFLFLWPAGGRMLAVM